MSDRIEALVAAADRLEAVTRSGDRVVVDQPIVAFLAGRRVPPELVDTANSRFESGSLTIEDVLSDDPPRYVIRWDSGRATVMAPLPGALRIEPAKGKASATNGKARTSASKPAAKGATAKATTAKATTAKAKPAGRTSTRKPK